MSFDLYKDVAQGDIIVTIYIYTKERMWLNWIPCRLIWWTSRIWLMLPDFLDLLILIFPTVISKHSEENPLCSLIWLIVLHICLDKGKFPKEAFLVDSRNSSDLFIYVKKSSLYLCLTCLTCTVYSVQCTVYSVYSMTRNQMIHDEHSNANKERK